MNGHGKITMFESVGRLAASRHSPALRQTSAHLQGFRAILAPAPRSLLNQTICHR
jgi:hypothetical protein